MAAVRAAAYCRYSSEGQRDGYSIEAQMNAIKSFCDSNGYELVASYVDEARSGTNDNRDQFQTMIVDSGLNKFEVVIVHKFDRFARDRYDSAIYKKKLKDNGVKLLSVLEPLDDSPESVIMEGLLEAMAEYYSKNLSRETLKGKHEAAKQCRFLGGAYPPFGYKITDDKLYAIVPEEAIIIQELFSRIAKGETYGAVCRDFLARGIVNRNGKPFIASSLARLITNPIYKGTYTFGIRSRDKSRVPIVVEDGCPAIVSKEIYDTVYAIHTHHKEEFKTRRHFASPREKELYYMLTGYIFCGECGSHYYGHKSKTTGHNRKNERCYSYEYNSYRCAKRRPKPEACTVQDYKIQCHNISLKKEQLEDFTVGLIEACIFNDKTINFIVVELEKRINAKSQQLIDMKSIKSSLSQLATQESRLLDIYLSGSISKETYEERSKKIKTQRLELESRLASATSDIKILTPEQIKSTLDRVLTNHKTDKEYRKNLIATFLDKILVFPDRLEYTFKLPIFDGHYSTSVTSSDFVRKSTTVST